MVGPANPGGILHRGRSPARPKIPRQLPLSSSTRVEDRSTFWWSIAPSTRRRT